MVVTTAVGVAVSVVVAQTIADEATYGRLNYFLWLAGLLTTLGILGVPQALTRFTADLRGREEPEQAAALGRWAMRSLVGFNLVASLALLLWALTSPPETRSYLLVVALLPALNAWGRVLASGLTGREHYRPTAVATVVAALAQLTLVLLAWTQGWGAFGYFVALVSPNVVTLLTLLWLGRRDRRTSATPPVRADPALVRRFLAFTLPITLQLLLDAVVWQRSEVFFLERLATLEEVGFYSMAFTLSAMIMALGWALINGFLPAIARDHGGGRSDEVRAKIVQAMVLGLVFAVPFTFGGLATISELLALVYGERWLPAVPAAQVLLIGLAPGVIAGVFGLTVAAIDRPWALLPLSGGVALLNVALDILLIPSYGAFGAAIANSAAQIGFAAAAWLILRRLTGARMPAAALIAVPIVGALTTFGLPRLLLPLLPGAVGLLVAIGAAAVAYVVAIALLSPRLPGLEMLARYLPFAPRS
jgi:O-antigen/teichoic acid export membrane protein